ncbi:hypothetical protein Dimus_009256 [Dionaea muscipula]
MTSLHFTSPIRNTGNHETNPRSFVHSSHEVSKALSRKRKAATAAAMGFTAAVARGKPLMVAVLMVVAVIADSAYERLPRRPLETGDASSSSSSSSSSPPVPMGIFIMGDSSVDCGDNTLFYPLLHDAFSLVPCNGSDSTLPHLLAKHMGLPRTPSFYNQNGTITGLMNGLNFGSALATILSTNSHRSSLSFQTLDQQLRQVFDTIQLLQLQLGLDPANQFIKSSVFYLSFGKDDYIHFLDYNNNNSSSFSSEFEARNFPRALVDEMMKAVRDLYDANVRNIVCMGILPLGCAPKTLFQWRSVMMRENKERICIDEINMLVSEYNAVLREQIYDLKIVLPDLHITFCDVYQGIMDIVANPNGYGFEDSRAACCGTGWLGAAVGCLSESVACNRSSGHVWWDLYNPSEAVNTLLADSAWSGHPFRYMCHPLTVQDLLRTTT